MPAPATGSPAAFFGSADYDASVSYGTIINTPVGFKTTTVTSLVNAWVNGGIPNNGLVLLAGGTDTGDAAYTSREGTTIANRPYLEIVWNLPAKVGSAVSLTAAPLFVAQSGRVTVTMSVAVAYNAAPVDVTPPANLTVSPGVTAVLFSGPEPTAATIPAGGGRATFTYVYDVTAGSAPQSVTFSGLPTTTSAEATFASGTSNSVLVVPPLTYRALVNDPLDVNVTTIINTATISDTYAFAAPNYVTSNQTTTPLLVPNIGDRVWLDENSDGVQDAGESGIANVRITLTGTAALGNPVLLETWTDSEGNYTFTDLLVPLSGTEYTISVDTSTLPAGLAANPTYDDDGVLDNQSAVDLSSGSEFVAADFGYNWAAATDVNNNTGTGAIGDRVWVDADGDGLQDPGEPGLAGVTVTLYTDPDGNGIYGNALYTTTTDANGNFIFDDLPAGSYVVVVNEGVAPAGYTPTADPDQPGAPCTLCDNRALTPIILAPGDVYLNADFGYMPLVGSGATIGDTIWLDADGDGLTDAGEPGIAGVSVALIQDLNGNGIWDAGEPIIATEMTDANGTYAFTGVPVTDGLGTDDYLIWVNDTNMVLTGLVPAYDSDGEGTPNISAVSDLAPSGNLLQDFGYKPDNQDSGEAVIGDTIFLDLNNDDMPDAGEGIEGVVVNLYDSSGTILLATTTTNENGTYLFGGLPAGTYVVQVAADSLPLGLAVHEDPDGTKDGQTTVTVAAGETNLLQDFGYRGTNNISGTIWNDRDADGILGTEAGLAGVTVALYDANGNLVATTVTDALGNYMFKHLPKGIYTVDVTDQANILDGYWHSLGAAATDNNSQPDPLTVSLTGGTVITYADFGYYSAPAMAGDRIFYDLNGDGIQAANEPGIAGVPVTLIVTYPDGTVTTVVAVTDASGAYSFGNLLLDEDYDGVGTAGSGGTEPLYTISVGTPAGYIASPSNLGTDDALDSDDGLLGEQTQPVMGAVDATSDFGFYRADWGDAPDIYGTTAPDAPRSIIFPDTDNNGLPDSAGTLPAIWLGGYADTETSTVGTPNANYDNMTSLNDEDGVNIVNGTEWFLGVDGGTISVNLSSSSAGSNTGYLAVWFDWNHDGDFADADEMSVATAVAWDGLSATQQVTFDIPDVYTNALTSDLIFRVRLFESQPVDLATAYMGLFSNGETEDYYASVNTLPVTMNYFHAVRQGDTFVIEWSTSTETGNVGFNLYLQDSNGYQKLNDEWIPATGFTSHEQHDYIYEAPAATFGDDVLFYLEDVDVQGHTRLHGPFKVNQVNGKRHETKLTDWKAIRAESEAAVAVREFNNKALVNKALANRANKIAQAIKPAVSGRVLTPDIQRTEPQADEAQVVLAVPVKAVPGPTQTAAAPLLTATPQPDKAQPRPTLEARPKPTKKPRMTATPTPTMEPTVEPTLEPTTEPTATPTEEPTVEPTVEPTATPTELPPAEALRVAELLVSQSGLYRISYEDLLASGIELYGQPAADIAVTFKGVPLAISVFSAELFGPGSYLEFYGQAAESLYTDTNVYTLWVDRAAALRIAEDTTLPAPDAAAVPFYMETNLVDRNIGYDSLSTTGDPWFNARMVVFTTPKTWSYPISIDHYVTDAAPVTLVVGLYGGTDYISSPDHHVVVSLNEVEVASRYFDATDTEMIEVQVPAGLTLESVNTVKITLPGDSGQPADVVYLDAYSITYPRSFWAVDGKLVFNAAGAAFEVDNLVEPEVTVYRQMQGEWTRLAVELNGTRARFTGSDQEASYYVASASAMLKAEIRAARPQADLTAGPAQYLIISHPAFMPGLEPLITARSADGLGVKVVDVFDLYDQYNYGIVDPAAIKNYIAYAAANLGTEYVLLVGDDTYDYKGYANTGSISFIPSIYMPVGDLVQYAPVDPKYADLNDDNVPDLPIGRLAVRTLAELQNVVSKTLAYGAKDYERTGVFASDWLYSDESDALIRGLPGDWVTTRAYLDFVGVDAAHDTLISSINQGAALTVYVGHSDDWGWTWDGLFEIDDAPSLTNTGRPTIMLQNGCWNIYYVNPIFDTLTDVMMNMSLQGSAAMLGSTALTSDLNEQRLGSLLMPLLSQPGMTVGQAMVNAKQALASTDPSALDVLLGWSLLGDPYLKVTR